MRREVIAATLLLVFSTGLATAQKSRKPKPPSKPAAVRSAESEAMEWYVKGDAYVGTAEEGSAVQLEAYRKAVELDPSLSAVRMNLALLHARKGEYQPALEQLEEILKRGPEQADALYLSGEFLLQSRQKEQARERFARVITREPEHAGALAGLGKISLEAKQYEEASGFYARSAQAKPTTESYFNLALAELSLGRRDQAVEALQKALALAPEDPDVLGLLGIVQLQQNKLPDAVASLRQALAGKPDALWYSHLGVALEQSNDFAGAAAAFQKAVDINPGSADDWAQLGIVRVRLKQNDVAMVSLQKAIALDGRHFAALATFGDLLLDRKDYETAVQTYRRALEVNPKDFFTSFNLGLALSESGRSEEALGAFRATLELAPDSGEVHRQLGLLYDKAGNVESAIEHFRKSLNNAPRSGSHFRLGVLLARIGQGDAALEQLEKAVALEPKLKQMLRDELRNVHSDLDSVRYKQRFADIIK